ncbi:MAG: tRNA (adenosine(37)-N6)-threonylcarbamoyltransferase complex transferase subunit TsaD [Ignavibacteriae bacterium]|nr:tRNA (adenosine(37)-N6)-threonylcarbamoyltransferase complex transferase subunit TsaD [Ignavibacteriota bacterium]
MNILAIESSCDETAASVISNSQVLSNIISSQHFHSKYGGVIPELASRAHLEAISIVVRDALDKAEKKIEEINAIAVTTEPGLIGSLIVGSNFAKGLSIKYNLPIVPTNHIEGHLYSGNIVDESIEFPYIALVVSGGHTALFKVESYSMYTMLGSTVDDASGEAFDKIGTMIGLPYPAGPEIDKLSKAGNPRAYNFPRAMLHSGNYNFSFSGLKTSIRYFLEKNFPDGLPEDKLPDVCASVQEAIIDVLVKKSIDASVEYNVKHLIIAGGVSANSCLRKRATDLAKLQGIKVVVLNPEYCIDNAAMIGFIAEKRLLENGPDAYRDLSFKVNASALRAKSKK